MDVWMVNGRRHTFKGDVIFFVGPECVSKLAYINLTVLNRSNCHHSTLTHAATSYGRIAFLFFSFAGNCNLKLFQFRI